MNTYVARTIRTALIATVALQATGCTVASRVMNPFYESPAPEAYNGELNDKALHSSGTQASSARQALEAMASYRAAQAPEPANPVMQPAVVRLMWVPDHLNKNGDLVPSHYYYLKVLKERWAVTDAFELEQQLGSNQTGSSDVPYVLSTDLQK